MKISNTQMHLYLDTLNEMSFCTGKLGYAIVRNTRLLREQCQDYLKMYEQALVQYGEVVRTETQTGYVEGYSMSPDSPNLNAFVETVQPLAEIEHEVDLYTLPYEDAMNQLTAAQMLQLDFMLVESSDN